MVGREYGIRKMNVRGGEDSVEMMVCKFGVQEKGETLGEVFKGQVPVERTRKGFLLKGMAKTESWALMRHDVG